MNAKEPVTTNWDDVTVRTVPELLDLTAASGRRALVASSAGHLREMTYAQLRHDALTIAAGLARLGLEHGDRLGILLDNSCAIEAHVAYHAAHRLGAINVPLNTRLRAPELIRAIELAGVRCIVFAEASRQLVDQIAESAGGVQFVCVGGGVPGALSWDELQVHGEHATGDLPTPGSDADWIFTSGTTSVPKVAMFTHEACVACGHGVVEAFDISSEDVYQSSSPFFTSTGIHTNLLGTLVAQATYLVTPDARVPTFLELAAQYSTTIFFQITTLLQLMLREHRAEVAALDSLRRVQYGGMALTEQEHRDIYRVLTDELGVQLSHAMGLTEGGPTGLCAQPSEVGRKPGSIGSRPFSSWARYRIDDSGDDPEHGRVGELCFQGPSLMRGYLGMPDEGLKDGWLRTGDLVRQDDEGYVYFVARAKDIVRRGGLNIAAAEVEAVLRSCVGVHDAAVIAKPHTVLGEDLLAYIEADPDIGLEDVQAHCREHLATFKVPRDIRVIANLPRNAMGRVQKATLRAELESAS